MDTAKKMTDAAARSEKWPLEDAYAEFRLERAGHSPRTLEHYDLSFRLFLCWVRDAVPAVRRVEDVDVRVLRRYRSYQAERATQGGGKLAVETRNGYERDLITFLRWARADGYEVDERALALPKLRSPWKEPTVYTVGQLHTILAACNPKLPQEDVGVRILVGSGSRRTELCGLARRAPDGLHDLEMAGGQADLVSLRVRWDAGAKGMKSRRVPIHPSLAKAIKRYEARWRGVPDNDCGILLLNDRGVPYKASGIDSMMDRLQERVGFRVYAHAFRHTFATVATQMGWSPERLRVAMGHEDYEILLRYVRLATERDLGPLEEWRKFIADPPAGARPLIYTGGLR